MLFVLLSNKRRYIVETLSEDKLWSMYQGDRDRAYQSLTAKMREKRGFKTASVVIFDQLEMAHPGINQQLKEHHREKLNKIKREGISASTQGGERQDAGFVAGFAKKDFYRLSPDKMRGVIENTDPNNWANMVKTGTIWPKPKLEKIMKESGCPEAAYVSHITRSILPNGFRNVTQSPGVLTLYIAAVREMRNTIHTFDTIEGAIYQATKCLYSVGIRLEDTRWVAESGEPWRVLGARQSKKSHRTVINFFLGEDDVTVNNFRQGFNNQKSPWDFATLSGKQRRGTNNRRSLADIPALDHIERVGPDWRGEGQVTEEDLILTFGFSGAEYGNSTSQKERSAYMAHTYDSFADLADITGLPKAALSLGGTLGLTYGLRGRGGKGAALAHFEPHNIAIALTRKKGAGSLGHEYFHALANYFGRQFTAGVTTADIAESMDTLFNREGSFSDEFSCENSGGMRKESFEAFSKLYWALTHEPESSDWSMIEPSDINKGTLTKVASWVVQSQKQDSKDGRKEIYWANPKELFARGMEAWCVSALESAGRKNDYLLRAERISSDRNEEFSIYPSGDHLGVIKNCVDEFFAAVSLEDKLVHHPIGRDMTLPTMYSRWGSCMTMPKALLAEQALVEVRRMLGENIALIITDEIYDVDGQEVDGEWLPALHAIRIADGMSNLSTVHHETYHGARQLLMTVEERKIMDVAFSPGQPAYEELREVLKSQGRNHLLTVIAESAEEAQAYGFQLFCRGDLELNESSIEKNIFIRIIEMLKSIFSVTDGYGCNRPQEIFDALYSGDLLMRRDHQTVENNKSLVSIVAAA